MTQGKIRGSIGHFGQEDLQRMAPLGHVLSDHESVHELPGDGQINVTVFQDGVLNDHPVTDFRLHRKSGGCRITSNLHTEAVIGTGQGLLTVDDDMDFIFRRPEAGMMVGVRAAADEPSIVLESISIPPAGPQVRCVFHENVELTFDVGYLMGVIVSDGWADVTGKICWAKTSPGLNDKICEIVNSLSCSGDVHFTIQGNEHDFDGHDAFSLKHTFSSKQWAAWIRTFLGTGALNKRLPAFWPQGSISFRRGLISGLIDGDGCVSLGSPTSKQNNRRPDQLHVHYTTSSPGLAEDVFLLARSLGLHATVTTSPPRGRSQEAYTLCFNEASKQAMRPWLQLYNAPKQEAFAQYEPSQQRQKGYYAPLLTRKRMMELGRICWSQTAAEEWDAAKERMRRQLYNAVADARTKGPGLLRDAAREIICAAPEAFSEGFWSRWRDLALDDRLRWEIVDSVTQVETSGFDLGLQPGQGVITAEGFIVGAETLDAAATYSKAA